MPVESIVGYNLNLGRTVEFFISFVLNSLVIFIIAKYLYFRIRRNKDYLFTLSMFNIIIFFICYFLSSIELSLGFAFGIFAIFSILRYRTETVPIKEMTYMFIAISVAIINAIASASVVLIEMIFTNAAILGLTYILEKAWIKNEKKQKIIYEKIELIKPERHEELLKDIQERTGLKVNRYEIDKIDFMRDSAHIYIFHYD
ncbi:MAG: DUF4956 domain-containing protein [Ignavibacteria bacterium]|nr:DUF4956 domain-containing protein [Ignavibacteria bacterium]